MVEEPPALNACSVIFVVMDKEERSTDVKTLRRVPHPKGVREEGREVAQAPLLKAVLAWVEVGAGGGR